MANIRVQYQVSNPVGGLIAEMVASILEANEYVNRVAAIFGALGSSADIEALLSMPAGHGDWIQAIINGAKSNLNSTSTDMGRLDQGV